MSRKVGDEREGEDREKMGKREGEEKVIEVGDERECG